MASIFSMEACTAPTRSKEELGLECHLFEDREVETVNILKPLEL